MFRTIVLSLILGSILILSCKAEEELINPEVMVKEFNSTIDSLLLSLEKIKRKVSQMKTLINESLGPDHQVELVNKVKPAENTTPAEETSSADGEPEDILLHSSLQEVGNTITNMKQRIEGMKQYLTPNPTTPAA